MNYEEFIKEMHKRTGCDCSKPVSKIIRPGAYQTDPKKRREAQERFLERTRTKEGIDMEVLESLKAPYKAAREEWEQNFAEELAKLPRRRSRLSPGEESS